jgi:ferredoxin
MGEAHGITVSIDRDLCVGNGICAALAPLAFALDDTMKAVTVDPDAEPEENLFMAAESCPTQAIYLSADGESVYP